MTTSVGRGQAQAPACTALPRLLVFDLDDCCWTPEMHELSGMPSVEVEGPLDPHDNNSTLGVVGMKVPSGRRGGWGNYGTDEEEVVELFDGARQVFRELALNPLYKDVKIAVASTSLEPSFSRACIKGLEIIEDFKMQDIISFSQIGRSGQLTSRKTSHFRLLHEESGIPFSEMVFWDDCNWGDHVGDIHRTLGVVGVRTPNGLNLELFEQGILNWRKQNV